MLIRSHFRLFGSIFVGVTVHVTRSQWLDVAEQRIGALFPCLVQDSLSRIFFGALLCQPNDSDAFVSACPFLLSLHVSSSSSSSLAFAYALFSLLLLLPFLFASPLFGVRPLRLSHSRR